MWWSNFGVYSTTLMPRNTVPSASVAITKRGTSFFLLVCADQTDMAIVKLLAISTMVLPKPSGSDSILPLMPKAVGNSWRFVGFVREKAPRKRNFLTRKIRKPGGAGFLLWVTG